jgi:endonuclease G
MATLDQLDRLRRMNSALMGTDAESAEEAQAMRTTLPTGGQPADIDDQVAQESIIFRRFRPVLAIRDNATVLAFDDPAEGKVWQARLQKAQLALVKAIRATGRIDLRRAGYEWVGTGWVVAEGILVTNRHVADLFTEQGGRGLTFAATPDGPVEAVTDFLQEVDNPAALRFDLIRPLHVEPKPGPDVAFFEIAPAAGGTRLAEPIPLATSVELSETVATIGYPAFDSRIPDIDLMEQIYGQVYDKKRLAPGSVTHIDDLRLWHTCTTLGGNSGSVVFDFDKGRTAERNRKVS